MTEKQNIKVEIKTKLRNDKFIKIGKYVDIKFDSKIILGSDNEVTNGIKQTSEKISDKADKIINAITAIN